MPDLAGAMKAMEDRFIAAWGATTGILMANDDATANSGVGRDPITGYPVPWVRFEVENLSSSIRGAGVPGQHVTVDEGEIEVLVSVPESSGRQLARQYAVQAGEIFRTKAFYRDTPGFEVRTWTPNMGRMGRGSSENPEGVWYVISVTIPYEFWSIA